ncbi:MAG: hypothetical protein IKM02_02070, partial [Clostridia bacterium]|nr:hypothetical protein [Clostridia bacterium]
DRRQIAAAFMHRIPDPYRMGRGFLHVRKILPQCGFDEIEAGQNGFDVCALDREIKHSPVPLEPVAGQGVKFEIAHVLRKIHISAVRLASRQYGMLKGH